MPCITKKLMSCPKDPLDAGVAYLFDFAGRTNSRGFEDWLQPGEALVTKNVTAEAGITVDSDIFSDANTAVVVYLSGGLTIAGGGPDSGYTLHEAPVATYEISCTVTTDSTPSRTINRTMIVKVADR